MAGGADTGEKPGTSFIKPPASPPSLESQRGGTEGPFCATCQGELKGLFQPKLVYVYSKKKRQIKIFSSRGIKTLFLSHLQHNRKSSYFPRLISILSPHFLAHPFQRAQLFPFESFMSNLSTTAASLTSLQALLLSFILNPWLFAFLYSQASAFPAFSLHVDNPADSDEFSFTYLQVKRAALGKFLLWLQR